MKNPNACFIGFCWIEHSLSRKLNKSSWLAGTKNTLYNGWFSVLVKPKQPLKHEFGWTKAWNTNLIRANRSTQISRTYLRAQTHSGWWWWWCGLSSGLRPKWVVHGFAIGSFNLTHKGDYRINVQMSEWCPVLRWCLSKDLKVVARLTPTFFVSG